MRTRYLVLSLLLGLLIVGLAVAEELHPLGAIYSEQPDWVLDSPEIILNNGLEELDEFVDNSAGLPPVGNQGSQGSCTAWACAYYYLTYTQGQDYGWDLTDRAHQMSPAFTYNLINGGGDNGSNPYDAFEVFETLGSATYEDMPYTQSNCTNFPPGEGFRNGLKFRTSATYSINVGSQYGVNQLKTHLANGNISMIAITVWPNFDNISSYNYNYCVNDIYGEIRGGHAVTVVGYDDSRVTSDGVGAFKMVNSWGPNWGQQGFWWMSYEAFMDDIICWGYALYADDIPQYEPTLVARVEPTHSHWYSLEYVLGSGTCDQPTASGRYFDFSNNGVHAYPDNAYFYIDLTEYAGGLSLTEPNYFFIKGDDQRAYDGHGGTINHVMIEDLVNEHYATCYSTPVPIPDNQNDAEIDVVLYHAAVPPASLDAAIDLSDGSIDLTWPAVTGGSDFLGYNVYRDGEMIAFTENTYYTDSLPDFGEYDYRVSSVWEPCQSWPTDDAHVNWWTPVNSSYPEVPALDGATGDFTLSWEQLRYYDVQYDDGTCEQELVFSAAAQHGAMMAQRFYAQHDGKLTKVNLFFPDCDYPMGNVKLKVFSQDGDGMPDVELASTVGFTPVAGEWNMIDLEAKRVVVTDGDPLWIAVWYSSVGTSAIGLDINSNNDGRMLSPDGANWMSMGGGGALMMRAEFGEEELIDGMTGLLGFKVYQDNELLGEVNNNLHEIDGTLPGAGTYTFRVDAIYQQGVWTGEDMELTWDGFTKVAENDLLPKEFAVSNAYPNPFNPVTSFNVTLPQAAELNVTVYNMLGQQVARLANGKFVAGEHRLQFDANGLSSGLYLVRVSVPGELNNVMKVMYLQ